MWTCKVAADMPVEPISCEDPTRTDQHANPAVLGSACISYSVARSLWLGVNVKICSFRNHFSLSGGGCNGMFNLFFCTPNVAFSKMFRSAWLNAACLSSGKDPFCPRGSDKHLFCVLKR